MAVRTSHVVLIATASLTVGVLIGTLFSSGITRVVTAATPASTAPSAAAPHADSTTSNSTLADVPPAEPRVAASETTPQSNLPPLPAAESDGTSGGAGAVTGSVATLEGLPVAGVQLELEPPKDAPKYRGRRTTSDSTGRFEFADLPRGEWRITARHGKYALQRRNSFPALVPTGTIVEFVACPAVPVDVRVTGEGGDRARVAMRRANGGDPEWSPWKPGETVLALSPGAWELCASVDALDDWPSDRGWKLAPIASPVVNVHVGGSESELVTLALEPARCFYGTVRLPAGFQSNEVNQSNPPVRLVETRAGTIADFEGQDDRLSRSIEIDHEGRFGFFALPFERWTAGVTLGDWGPPQVVQIVDVTGLTRRDLMADSEAATGVLVEAFTAGGDRVTEGVLFYFLHRDAHEEPDKTVWQGARTLLEPGGAMHLIPVPLEKSERERAAKKSELVLRAALPGFARIDQPLPGLTGERLRLTFVPGAELEIELVGDGAERAMRRCNAQLEGSDHESLSAEFDEAARVLKFTSLSPGNYTLTVMTWGADENGQWRSTQLHKGEVAVRAGPQRITLQMPARAGLLVHCPGVKKDVNAVLSGPMLDPAADRDDSWWQSRINSKVDASGQVKFENIVAGRYSLTIGQRMQLVTVPCPPVDFVGRIPERHRFRLRNGDSPLRRAGVRSGDVYAALDGETVDMEEARKRLGALSSESAGTLRLTVERDGQKVDLVLDAAALGENESFETYLEPVVD